ncbi:MAG: serine/threonine-protein kinase [Planctomycetales bacterium]
MSDTELVLGKYKLINCIASGQNTQIWEAGEQGSPEKFALKMLLPAAFKDGTHRATLKREASILKSFDHPNIVKFHEFSMTREFGFFTMELFRCPNLKSHIQTDIVGLQSRIKRLVELTCLALGHLHEKKYIHRDIKPDNILFSRGSELRLVDFSLTEKMSGFLGRMFSRKKKLVQGTRTYMSPEQIRGKALGPESDIYSLGVTVYEILCGRAPFLAGNPKELLKKHLSATPITPSELNPNITPEMDKFVLRLLAKKPADRPRTTADVLAELRGIEVWFKPPETLVKVEKAEDKEEFGLGERRDSRSDALRQEMAKKGILPTAKGPTPPVPPPQAGAPTPPAPPRPPGAPVPPAPPRPVGGPPSAPQPPAAPRPPTPVGGATAPAGGPPSACPVLPCLPALAPKSPAAPPVPAAAKPRAPPAPGPARAPAPPAHVLSPHPLPPRLPGLRKLRLLPEAASIRFQNLLRFRTTGSAEIVPFDSISGSRFIDSEVVC